MATQAASQNSSSFAQPGQLGAGASDAGSNSGGLVGGGSSFLGHQGPLLSDGGVHQEMGALRLSPACARLPVELAVSVPVRNFRVRHLLSMAPGEVIETLWGHGEDLPLASGEVQLAWSEFEVVDTRLAVRVTRLA